MQGSQQGSKENDIKILSGFADFLALKLFIHKILYNKKIPIFTVRSSAIIVRFYCVLL
jgi:hypothetical protein